MPVADLKPVFLSCERAKHRRVRNIACLLAAVPALAGCMTLGDSTPPPADATPPAEIVATAPPQLLPSIIEPTPVAIKPPARPQPRPKKPVREASARPVLRESKAEVIDPHSLIGMAPNAVTRLLGTPAWVKDDQLSREWVYASPGCSFRLFFYPNLNAASFRVLKFGTNDGNGGSIEASNVCIRHILTAKNDATD